MKGKVLRKALTAALALLIVSGSTPIKPVADLFGGAAVTVSAAELASGTCGDNGDNATWSLDDAGKLTISGTGDMDIYYGNGQPWYNYKDDITSVVIEDGITSIGSNAFYKYTGLTSITIPDSVTRIGHGAFQVCTSLTSVTIPDSVESIGNQAFQDCTSLTSVKMSKNVTSIGNQAFSFCTSLTSITIPDSVTSIGSDAFYICTGITDVYCYAYPDKLTWNEGGCDDFMGDPESRETICHVPAEHIDDYNSEEFSDVNVTFAGDLVDMGLGEHLYGHSITLDGSIGVNFYVELTDELLASETAEMVFTVPNGSKTETQTLLVKDVITDESNKVSIGGKTYYKFRCSISAKDMASTITAQMKDGDKTGSPYSYTVRDYADYLLAHTEVEEYANAALLVKAMLNYGACAQIYFDYNPNDLANKNLADNDRFENWDMEWIDYGINASYDSSATTLPTDVTFEGATLSLKSETSLSLYFTGLDAKTEFKCTGNMGEKTVETDTNGAYVIARIRGIKAEELGNRFVVKFSINDENFSVTYSPMTYCCNVLNGGSDDENLQNVVKALYKYNKAAEAYSSTQG